MKVVKLFGAGVLGISLALAFTGCSHHGPRGCHHFAGRMVERKVREIERTLNLTDAQKVQFKELRGRIKSDMIAHLEDKQRFLNSVNQKLQNENVTMDEIVTITRTHMKKEHAMMEEKLSYITEFYTMLTPEQKRILNTKVREHLTEKQGTMRDLIEDLQKLDN